jgi:hypothetical protein
MDKLKRHFYLFIHFNFIIGFLYAFYHFLITPRATLAQRRLWAYESWIIFSFYCLFLFLIIFEQETKLNFEKFKKILIVNLILLVFPWGLFLLLAPANLLGMLKLNSIYWRVLGGFSLLGAILYYLPYRFYDWKWTKYILIFGFIDNFIAGLFVFVLFLLGRSPFIVLGAVPLLFYFSFFFLRQAREYELEKD